MNYAEWLSTVPSEISNDPIWKLDVYRFTNTFPLIRLSFFVFHLLCLRSYP